MYANLPTEDEVLLGVHMRFWMQAHMLACALMVPGAMQIVSLLSVCGYNVASASVDGGGLSRSGGGRGWGGAKSAQVLVGALVVVLVQVSQATYVLVYRQMCTGVLTLPTLLQGVTHYKLSDQSRCSVSLLY